MPIDPQTRARFIGEVIFLISGTIFIVIGLVALVVAAIRRRAGGWRAVLWLGIWSALYGIQRINDCGFLVALLPHGMQVSVAYAHGFATYFVLVAGLLTFRELTLVVVLTTRDNITLPVVIWSSWLSGSIGESAALAVIMLAGMTPIIWATWFAARRFGLVPRPAGR